MTPILVLSGAALFLFVVCVILGTLASAGRADERMGLHDDLP